MYKFFSILILILVSKVIFSQEPPHNEINWLTIEQAEEMIKKQPKKILIDFYTDWCGPCKMMSSNTFKDPNIVNYINTNFYAVKFNAEGPDSAVYKGKTYYNKQYDKNKKGRNSTHELTMLLAPSNGRIAYPTIVYLDEELNIMSAVPGYMKPRQIQPVLIYFAENLHKVTPYDHFSKSFEKTFYDTSKTESISKINWLTIEEAEQKSKKNPKKIILHLDSEWSYTSKIMLKATYEDSIIADYINKNFYPVLFNSTEQDTITFNGNIFINENKQHPFHQFAVSMLNGKMTFPSTIFINTDFGLLSAVPGYQANRNLEPILHFFNEDAFKTKNWEEFIKTFETQYSDQ